MNAVWKRLAISTTMAVTSIGLAAAPANAQDDRVVQIINDTQHSIVRFFASNVGRDTWEEDILGQDVLPVGQSVNINFDDGTGACLYDFKAVFDDGEELVRSGIDVCSIGTYRYTEG